MNDDTLLNKFKELESPAVSDALDSLGITKRIKGIFPRSKKTQCVGFAYTIQYELFDKEVSNQGSGNYIDDVKSNEVVVLDNAGRDYCTTWGGLLTKVAEIKNISGVVINGAVRDIDTIKVSNMPIFSKHVFMCSAKNRSRMVKKQCPLIIDGVKIDSGDIIFGDNNGALVIPYHKAAECLERAQNIKETEENILKLVMQGEKLEVARSIYKYSQPWLRS